jgi:hypothetical protein
MNIGSSNTIQGGQSFLFSDDDGNTWTSVPVALASSFLADSSSPAYWSDLAFDPTNQSIGAYAVRQTPGILIATTSDGFKTVDATFSLGLQPGQNALSVRVSADAFGDFFVAYGQRSLASTGSYGSSNNNGEGDGRQTMIAFRPSAIKNAMQSSQGSGGQASGGRSSGGTTPSGSGAFNGGVPVRTCALAQLAQPQQLPGSPPAQYMSGSVTFDGSYLDYTTHLSDTSGPMPEIFRIDPETCSQGAPLRPAVPPAVRCGKPVEQNFWALTYDARYLFGNGDMGALLAYGSGDARLSDPNYQAPIYAIDTATGDIELAAAAYAPCVVDGNPVYPRQGDPFSFTYDVLTDQLWTDAPSPPDANPGNPGSNPHPWRAQVRNYDVALGRLPVSKGDKVQIEPSCLQAQGFVPGSAGRAGNSPNNGSAMVVGAAGKLYVQAEDDATVFHFDTARCVIEDTFTHRGNSEATDENDQLACDAVTFGDQSGNGSQAVDRSVLWIRDTSPNTISAYPIPDGYCPFPTRITVPDLTAYPGSQVSICGLLTKANPEVVSELSGESLTIGMTGATRNQVRTDRRGQACVAGKAPSAPGRYPLAAAFAGTHAYLPSTGTGTLTVVAPAATTLGAGSVAAIGSPPSSPTQPLSQAEPPAASEVQVAEQAQAQAQVQAQTEAQAQAQAHTMAQVQPGMMVQAQRRTQVATQEQGIGVQASYNASAIRSARAPATGLAVAFMMFGFGVLVRRHRWSTVPSRHGSRPRR